MKNETHLIAKLIRKKTNAYLKIAIIIFTCSLLIAASYLMFFLLQHGETNRNFEQNVNVHIIRISGKFENEKTYRMLNNQDRDKISDVLGDKYNYSIIPVPVLTGATDINGEGYSINCLNEKDAYIAGEEALEEDTIYMVDNDKKSIELYIPRIKIVEEGVTSDTMSKYKLNSKRISKESSPITLYKPKYDSLNYAVVNEKTFFDIFQKMYDIPENITSIYDVALQNLVHLDEIYVYAENLNEIDEMVNTLQTAAYDTTYVFEAFDSFSNSLFFNNSIYNIFLVFIMGISFVYIMLSFNSYLKIQQKDMGILKHWGYDSERVCSIYGYLINKIFLQILAVAIVFCVFLGTILWVTSDLSIYNVIFVVLIICLLVLITSIGIKQLFLKKYISKDTLYLLKYSKEFE